MKRGGLGWRLGIAFAGVALFTALLVVTILAVQWQREFEGYLRANLSDRAAAMADNYARGYAMTGGWNWLSAQDLTDLSHVAEVTGSRIELVDGSGKILLDTGRPASGPGSTVSRPLTGPVEDAPVIVNGGAVGLVRISSPKGVLLSTRDAEFVRSSLLGVLLASLLAVGVATFAGLVYSRLIVRPIDHVTRVAAALRAGDADARTKMTGADAIGVLGHTLDEMADSIEADREFERRLTADVAHELRTPLQAIQATVEAMQDGVLPADEERLGVVRDETVRLSRLADSILEFARLERGSVRFDMRPTELAQPVGIAIEAHRALLESSGLHLEERLEPGVRVLADEDRLTQAVGNLLSNAARYTPEGGTVSVTVARSDGRAVLSVADTGIGIPESDLPLVFTRFWRSSAARERSAGGLGIGLAVVKEIAERHGGDVSARSRDDAAGTVFTISLPVFTAPAVGEIKVARP